MASTSLDSSLTSLLSVLEALPAGLMLLDPGGRCFYINSAGSALIGLTPEAILGTEFTLQFAPLERESIAAQVSASLADGLGSWTSLMRLPAGGERVIEFSLRRSVADGRSLVAVTLRDASERRRLTRTSAALAQIAASMTYAGTLEATLNALARSVMQAIGVEACSVFLVDERGGTVAACIQGIPEEFVDRLRAIWQSGRRPLSLRAMEVGHTVVVRNVPQTLLADPAFAPVAAYLRAAPWDTIISVPLIYGGRALGALTGHYTRNANPGPAEIAFLATIADQAAVAVENARLAAEAQERAALEERLNAEKQLRQTEEQYRRVFEATTDAMIISDMDGFTVEANPACCQMYGYAREEFLALHPKILSSEDLDVLRGGGSLQEQAVNHRKDGQAFHVEGRAVAFTYRGTPHVLAVIRDITERVQAYELLEQRVEERTRELATLLDVSRNVASTLEIKPLLSLILDQLKTVVDFDGATIMGVDGADLINLARVGPGRSDDVVNRRFPMAPDDLVWQAMHRGEPVIIGDVRGDTPLAIEYRRVNREVLDTALSYVRCWMGVPIMLKDRVLGLLSLASIQQDHYQPHHASLARAIADQVAVAIENAGLYEQARELAALEERQRLARELHDSVTQALFGIGLGARTARTLIDRDPEQAAESIDYVLSLAHGGMAEMRALIFELRPESLETEGLVAALQKQADATSARYEIPVHLALCDEPAAPLPVKEALYRIAQEALHNTVKHARASSIWVLLECTEGEIVLEVRDDGQGFDTGGSFPGHLGLCSMAERAARHGGAMEIESSAGQGTTVRVRIPVATKT
jgi:PAS domain S-box-containing protein